eukprot:scaffold52073_cov17-Tisochrysis_lutea.AAC.1
MAIAFLNCMWHKLEYHHADFLIRIRDLRWKWHDQALVTDKDHSETNENRQVWSIPQGKSILDSILPVRRSKGDTHTFDLANAMLKPRFEPASNTAPSSLDSAPHLEHSAEEFSDALRAIDVHRDVCAGMAARACCADGAHEARQAQQAI